MTDRERLSRLIEQLRRLPLPATCWQPDDGSCLASSQVWTVSGGCGLQPTWLWLVLECVGEGLVNAVPLFPWGELAGPDDVYVPQQWAGSTVIVSLELENTLDRSALGECRGRLPAAAMRYIAEAQADLDDAARRHAHNWGLGYLDAADQRLAYHEAIGTRIEELQAPVRAGFSVPRRLSGPGQLA